MALQRWSSGKTGCRRRLFPDRIARTAIGGAPASLEPNWVRIAVRYQHQRLVLSSASVVCLYSNRCVKVQVTCRSAARSRPSLMHSSTSATNDARCYSNRAQLHLEVSRTNAIVGLMVPGLPDRGVSCATSRTKPSSTISQRRLRSS